LAQLDEEFVRSDAVQRLFERVHVIPSANYDTESPGSALTDQVVLTSRDGSRHESAAVRHARGHAQLPLTKRSFAPSSLTA
jgi:2-methylcitrate dehydratase PrpD